jgi:hypothetical protein
MANPLRDEDKIYEKIKKENITVHPLIWELISHHIRNDLFMLSLPIDSLRSQPLWTLKIGSFVIKFLYRITFQKGQPEDLINICDKSLGKIDDIDKFLKKLKEATYRGK